MKEIKPNQIHDPEALPTALCPSCAEKVPVLPAESATCGCGHRFPLADPGEKGPVRYIEC